MASTLPVGTYVRVTSDEKKLAADVKATKGSIAWTDGIIEKLGDVFVVTRVDEDGTAKVSQLNHTAQSVPERNTGDFVPISSLSVVSDEEALADAAARHSVALAEETERAAAGAESMAAEQQAFREQLGKFLQSGEPCTKIVKLGPADGVSHSGPGVELMYGIEAALYDEFRVTITSSKGGIFSPQIVNCLPHLSQHMKPPPVWKNFSDKADASVATGLYPNDRYPGVDGAPNFESEIDTLTNSVTVEARHAKIVDRYIVREGSIEFKSSTRGI